jgi:hypothetical protein
MANIKKGYQLIVHSYAGDMDSWHECEINGLSLEKVKAFKELLKILDKEDTYSNSFSKDIQVQANHLFTEVNGLSDYFEEDLNRELEKYEDYAVADLLYEVLGSAESYDRFNTIYSYNIYYHENDLEDIAKKI